LDIEFFNPALDLARDAPDAASVALAVLEDARYDADLPLLHVLDAVTYRIKNEHAFGRIALRLSQ